MSKIIESETKIQNCINCPDVPGRSCMRYKAGTARLVFTPKETPEGIRFGEPYSIKESIEDCRFRQEKGCQANPPGGCTEGSLR